MSKGQRTEAAFLQAARETFAEKGFFNTKISDIAARAGRSPGSFYNYYDSKEQLLEALLSSFTDEVMSASLPPVSGDPEAGVRAAVTAYWITYKRYLPEMIGLFQMSMTDPDFRERWRANRAVGTRLVLSGLTRAERSGQQIGLPLDLLASALVALLESFCWTWLAAGGDTDVQPPDDDTAIELLTALWYRAVYRGGSAGA